MWISFKGLGGWFYFFCLDEDYDHIVKALFGCEEKLRREKNVRNNKKRDIKEKGSC